MKKKNLRQILIPAFIITACIPITIFTVISQARLKKSTLDNMNNQAEADLQKSNQCLNMTLDKYETILYDITTAEDFLNLAVTAKESAGSQLLYQTKGHADEFGKADRQRSPGRLFVRGQAVLLVCRYVLERFYEHYRGRLGLLSDPPRRAGHERAADQHAAAVGSLLPRSGHLALCQRGRRAF